MLRGGSLESESPSTVTKKGLVHREDVVTNAFTGLLVEQFQDDIQVIYK